MDPRIREIINTMPACRETIREASQYITEDGEELDAWIGETVRNLDAVGFGYLVVGAVHRGLPVRSRHLEHGLKFLPGYQTSCCLILRVTGDDVPERVERALRLGGIEPSSHALILIAVWHWCADRGMPFPQDLMNAARGYAHRFRNAPNCRGMFLHLAMLAGDRRIKEMITGGELPDSARETLETKTEALNAEVQSMFRGDILDTVAEKPRPLPRPKTLRRAVEHIGRNDPCPCGSGKKHKRCCFEKTRERLLDSSDVEGLTMCELDSELEAHMTLDRLNSLNNMKLMRLDPVKLDPSLIPSLIDRLCLWKLFDEATIVLEKTGLTEELEEKWQHLVMHAAQARRKNVLRRLVALHTNPAGLEERDYLHVAARLLLAEGDAETTLAILEEAARMLVDGAEHDSLFFHAMGFVLSPLGALGILLTQAMLARLEIKDSLRILEFVATRRAELDLPIQDPMVAIIEKRIAAEARKEEHRDSAKLAAAMRKMDSLAEKERKASAAAQQMEKELARLTRKAAERKEAAPHAPPHDDSEIKALREKLRIHEANERINADERAAHRRATSELLLLEESLREKERKLAKAAPARGDEDDDESHILQGELEGAQPLRLITFPGKFLATLRPLPRHVGRQAMALLGRIASGEPAAFHDVLRLKACHDIFRARVGIDHRLLFRLHPEELEVIALIDRRDLDARIKTLRKHE